MREKGEAVRSRTEEDPGVEMTERGWVDVEVEDATKKEGGEWEEWKSDTTKIILNEQSIFTRGADFFPKILVL